MTRAASPGPTSPGRRAPWWLRWPFVVLAGLVLLVLLLVTGLHLRFSNLPGETLRLWVAVGFVAGSLAAFGFLPRRGRTALWFLAVCVAVQVWWWTIAPSHDRDWAPSFQELPSVRIDGDQVFVRNVRNFQYRSETDFDVRYEDRTYDLAELRTVDFVMSYWDGNAAIAHTMFSFGFADGRHLALSAETRKERGEPQTGLRGQFKQYELIFILADERDLLRLRTDFRHEDVFVYPTTSPPEQVRALFLEFMGRVNSIHAHPEWYNTITNNCTTALLPHLRRVGRGDRSLWSVLKNGYTDRMAYESGWIPGDLPYMETRHRYHANRYVGTDADLDDYSRRIRPGRPGVTAPR